jgi:hypothetical protein
MPPIARWARRLGNTLVTVDAGARTAEALVILVRHGMDFGPSGTERFAAFDRAAWRPPLPC